MNKNYFLGSYILTIIGVIFAYLWGERTAPGTGFNAIFIVLTLGILEVSLSFDNAVVNAMRLENMSQIWRKRFLTWGIAIAVFGVRFLFPILVVAIFAKIGAGEVLRIALHDAPKYAEYLEKTHAPIVTFGGSFLMLLFLHYFINKKKEIHWIKPIEKLMQKSDKIPFGEVIVASLCVIAVHYVTAPHYGNSILYAGFAGIIIYELIELMTSTLEKKGCEQIANSTKEGVKCTGLLGFIYLELIDASFSLDGVLGAFALSKDILIITTGVAIGAMFVRSLTIYLLEKKTLAKFLYLEHGAHWAIGALALMMFISAKTEIPEVITGTIGLFFIITSLISSLIHNKKLKNQ